MGPLFFDDLDHHVHHCNRTYALAYHPVTSFPVMGLAHFVMGLGLSHAVLTQREADVAKHFPDLTIPRGKGAEPSAQQVDPVLLQALEC